MNLAASGCLARNASGSLTPCSPVLFSFVSPGGTESWSSGPDAPRMFSRSRPLPTPPRSRWLAHRRPAGIRRADAPGRVAGVYERPPGRAAPPHAGAARPGPDRGGPDRPGSAGYRAARAPRCGRCGTLARPGGSRPPGERRSALGSARDRSGAPPGASGRSAGSGPVAVARRSPAAAGDPTGSSGSNRPGHPHGSDHREFRPLPSGDRRKYGTGKTIKSRAFRRQLPVRKGDGALPDTITSRDACAPPIRAGREKRRTVCVTRPPGPITGQPEGG